MWFAGGRAEALLINPHSHEIPTTVLEICRWNKNPADHIAAVRKEYGCRCDTIYSCCRWLFLPWVVVLAVVTCCCRRCCSLLLMLVVLAVVTPTTARSCRRYSFAAALRASISPLVYSTDSNGWRSWSCSFLILGTQCTSLIGRPKPQKVAGRGHEICPVYLVF